MRIDAGLEVGRHFVAGHGSSSAKKSARRAKPRHPIERPKTTGNLAPICGPIREFEETLHAAVEYAKHAYKNPLKCDCPVVGNQFRKVTRENDYVFA